MNKYGSFYEINPASFGHVRPANRYGILLVTCWFLSGIFISDANSNDMANKVEITIDTHAIVYLDQNPFYDTSFSGTFSGNAIVYAPSELSYRGSYTLYDQIFYKIPQRNWKVKTPKGLPYRNFRVWNFNYEPFLRQNLACELMENAGVPCVEMRQVMLYVNGQNHGLYSEYPDPDNKPWLKQTFGNPADEFVGDLFKAATDKPNLTEKYFADGTILGVNDSDYYLHYNKKTNDSTDLAAGNYSSLIKFLTMVNETPDAQFSDTIDTYFDVVSFLDYLIVANYLDFWDGYPNRAKNYWLYHNPHTNKWVFIPWDLDATFDPVKSKFNNMGTECSYLFMYNETDLNRYYTTLYQTSNNGKTEVTPRPLFTRIMNVTKYRDLYTSRYKEALATYLREATVLGKLDSLKATAVEHGLSRSDLKEINASATEMALFIQKRTISLQQQLSVIAIHAPFTKAIDVQRSVTFDRHGSLLNIVNSNPTPARCDLYLSNGKSVAKLLLQPNSKSSLSMPANGILLYTIRGSAGGTSMSGVIVSR